MLAELHVHLRHMVIQARSMLPDESAFVWLHRLVALKMLEAREALPEEVTEGSILRLCAALHIQGCTFFGPDRPRIDTGTLQETLSLLNDSTLAPLWSEDDTLGWAYQYFNAAEHQEVLAQMRGREALKAAQVATATQFYTPRWIVRALVENSLGRLWLQAHPDSRLVEMMDYLVCDVKTSYVRQVQMARDIALLDPACGTMHFGLVAFDLLAAMYREELERAGTPGWPMYPSVEALSEIPKAILEQNLFGADIDQGALQIAAVALFIKAKSYAPDVPLGPCRLTCQDFLQSEDQRRYDVIVGNPPYLTSAKLPQASRNYLKQHYPAAATDLYAAFVDRSITQLAPRGRLAFITSESFMFLSSYVALRAKIEERTVIETVLHLGPHAFPQIGGTALGCAAFVLRGEENPIFWALRDDGIYFRLVRYPTSEAKQLAFEQAVSAMRAAHSEIPPDPAPVWEVAPLAPAPSPIATPAPVHARPAPISLASRRRKRALPDGVEQLALFG